MTKCITSVFILLLCLSLSADDKTAVPNDLEKFIEVREPGGVKKQTISTEKSGNTKGQALSEDEINAQLQKELGYSQLPGAVVDDKGPRHRWTVTRSRP